MKPAAGEILEKFRLQLLTRPHQLMLHHVARDRGQRQQQERHADRGDHRVAERLGQRQQAGTVGADHP
ncbi:hypothetical protein ACVIM8_005484 [Bradyrhizobium sp. USDA 4529]